MTVSATGLALSAIGFFLLLGGVAVLAACLFPGYRARHPGRARVAVGVVVIGFVVLVAAGRLMMLPAARTANDAPTPAATDRATATPPPRPVAPPNAGTSPVERHPWIVLPFAFAFGLVMITAMLEWTAAFLVRRPSRAKAPEEPDELRKRLLALNESGAKYQLVPAKECDLKLEWDVVDASWHNLFSKIKLSTIYGARLLFDPTRHEVRWCEWLRTRDFFIGVHGWGIVINWSWQLQVGYIDVVWKGRAYGVRAGFPPRVERIYDFSLNTVEVKREISAVVMHSGWAFRPVIFWFQAGRSRLQTLLSSWSFRVLPNWPETWARGLLASLTWVLFIGYLLWMIIGVGEPSLWTGRNLGILATITAGWWAIWGLMTWLFVYLAKPRREPA